MLNFTSNITTPSANALRPERVLISYNSGELSCHAVRKNGEGNYYLQAAVMADRRSQRRFAERLLRHKGEDNSGLGFVAEQIVYQGASGLTAWVSARTEANLWLQTGSQTRGLHTTKLPRLVFVCNVAAPTEQSWRCFALADTPCGAETPLAHAPLWNLSDRGRFCFGNASLPAVQSGRLLSDWESPLFESKFTHVNHQQTIRSRHKAVGTMDLWQFWHKLSQTKKFSVRSLVPCGYTLGKVIQELEG